MSARPAARAETCETLGSTTEALHRSVEALAHAVPTEQQL